MPDGANGGRNITPADGETSRPAGCRKLLKIKCKPMKKGLISLLFLLSCGVWDAAAQDLIVKKDGTNVEAKVLEIGEKDIKYKKASHLDGPTYLVSVANVVYIRFEDGSTDIFSQEDYDRLAPRRRIPHRRNSRNDPRRALSRDVTSRATISTRTACGASSSRSTPKGTA